LPTNVIPSVSVIPESVFLDLPYAAPLLVATESAEIGRNFREIFGRGNPTP
jgi:hypothetical protein